MGVVEAGNERPAGAVDDGEAFGVAAEEIVVADQQDTAVADDYHGGARPRRVNRDYIGVLQYQVGLFPTM